MNERDQEHLNSLRNRMTRVETLLYVLLALNLGPHVASLIHP